ncbi:PRC-barrel domain-containing protein [Pseudooceanicola atlanticus]|uniref:PRC-barrel domain-containing protein n=1 Tax=Pseudooceanicola atlanticus TaxID=1461694 RepID=A0A0A0EIP0_9RHOB|nr:PRC-barrel domain-containing protein [Pseudooceanicola atlanticus]KGM49047.1 hypothetical protein ATO9_10205 [Pseudooceanicola atlanticus]
MKPLKTTLYSTAAILALISGPVMAQDTSVSGDVSGSAEVGVESGDAVSNTADAVENTGEEIADTAGDAADAVEETAEDTAQAAEDAAEDTAQAAENTAEEAGDAVADTAEDMTPDANAEAEAEMTAESDMSTDGGEMGAETQAGALVGMNVASSAGEDIGEIDRIVDINGETMAVIGVGGFLGLGEHDVALPVTELMYDGNTITAMGYTQEQLKSMAEYNAELATEVDSEATVSLGRS